MRSRVPAPAYLLAALLAFAAACEPHRIDSPDASAAGTEPTAARAGAPTADPGGPYTGIEDVAVHFDGTGSTDPNGNYPLTYSWSFGDGATGTGPTPTHVYAVPGTYKVMLKVKDSTNTNSKPVSTTATIAANQAPVADPGGPYSAEAGTEITFSGSGTDPDGQLPLTYAWNFGDGGTATGQTPTHTYSVRGTYTVSLVVTDALGKPSAPATTTAQITGNSAPTANAGAGYLSRLDSAVVFDGTGSSDPDGDALTYAWDFGDGTSGTGATPSHKYRTAGTYTATLVVTDPVGASSAPATAPVTITADLVVDRFSRTLSQGWGSATSGQSWFIDAALVPDFRVDGLHGLIVAPTSAPRNVVSRGISGYGMNVSGITSFTIDQFPQTGAFFTVQTYCRRDDRLTDGDNYYRMRVRAFGPADALATSGKLDIRFEKAVAGVNSFVTAANTTIAATWAPGVRMRLRWQCLGTSPSTVLRMRVWRADSTEPTAWDETVTVNEPALDVIGTTGFRVEGPSSNTSGTVIFPVTFTFDDLVYQLR